MEMRWAFVFTLYVSIGIVTAIAHASTLTFISDLISDSAPYATPTHTIQFTVTEAIPPSGSIVIWFQDSPIPADFDQGDVDLAVSSGGPFVDRDIATTSDAVFDGVTVISGDTGSITIDLNSTTGISAGDRVQIELGSNATYNAAGVHNILNAAGAGSFRVYVETRDASAARLDLGITMVAMIFPVGLSARMPVVEPTLSNGLPSGLIAAGNTQIELSVESLIPATCRFSTIASTTYDSMTNTFTSALQGRLFYVTVGGHQNDTTYTYYVRCRATGGGTNQSDYPINFTLKPTPISHTSIESEGFVTGGPQGNLGNGGSGDFNNGSRVLYLSSVLFSGSTIPNSRVTILKDGFKATNVTAGGNGKFETTIEGMERGSYGFQLYTQDSRGLLSSLHSTTLTLGQGTQNEITNITLPPTIQISKNVLGLGEKFEASGGASPNAAIEVRVVSITAPGTLKEVHTFNATSTENGSWSATIDTKGFQKSGYGVQARVLMPDETKSGWSKQLNIAVGASTGGSCGKPDMNGDEKVNLVDFSIFLLHWQTDHAEADYTCDKQVNLSDFSVMLFNWTG